MVQFAWDRNIGGTGGYFPLVCLFLQYNSQAVVSGWIIRDQRLSPREEGGKLSRNEVLCTDRSWSSRNMDLVMSSIHLVSGYSLGKSFTRYLVKSSQTDLLLTKQTSSVNLENKVVQI